jgi:hypothetical protein
LTGGSFSGVAMNRQLKVSLFQPKEEGKDGRHDWSKDCRQEGQKVVDLSSSSSIVIHAVFYIAKEKEDDDDT